MQIKYYLDAIVKDNYVLQAAYNQPIELDEATKLRDIAAGFLATISTLIGINVVAKIAKAIKDGNLTVAFKTLYEKVKKVGGVIIKKFKDFYHKIINFKVVERIKAAVERALSAFKSFMTKTVITIAGFKIQVWHLTVMLLTIAGVYFLVTKILPRKTEDANNALRDFYIALKDVNRQRRKRETNESNLFTAFFTWLKSVACQAVREIKNQLGAILGYLVVIPAMLGISFLLGRIACTERLKDTTLAKVVLFIVAALFGKFKLEKPQNICEELFNSKVTAMAQPKESTQS